MPFTNCRHAVITALTFLFAASAHAATYTVNTLADSGDGVCDASCTLRDAIIAANASTGQDTIDFGGVVSPGDTIPVTIQLATGLPKITDSVIMDASIAETRALPGSPTRRPGVVIDLGAVAPNVVVGPFGPLPFFPNGLHLDGPGASDSTIRGLVIITVSIPEGSFFCEVGLFNPNQSDPTVPDLNLCSRGILLFGADRVTIAGNYINLAADGFTPAGSGVSAINLIDSSDNTIGGPSANDRNVVTSSGSTFIGPSDPMITVKLHGWAEQVFGVSAAKSASNNLIAGNFVGVNAMGDALNPISSGIVLWSSNAEDFSGIGLPGRWGWGAQCGDQELDPCDMSDNVIENNTVTNGASSLENIGGSRNTVFRNNTVFNTMLFPFQFNWIEVLDLVNLGLPGPPPAKAINMVISGNRLGIDRNGNPSGLNQVGSIQVRNCDNVLIADNIITGSLSWGVAVIEDDVGSSCPNVTMMRNSIYGHGVMEELDELGPGLGIELHPSTYPHFGVTENDFQDVDTGPNDLQNYPVLTWAREWKGKARIKGHLNSEPGKEFRIEFFANDVVHWTGYGEGKRYLGAVTVKTNGGGNAKIDTRKDLEAAFGELVDSGDFVTATATQLCTPDMPEEGDCPFASAGTSEFSLALRVR